MVERSEVTGWDSVPSGGPEMAPQELIDESARELEDVLNASPGALDELRLIVDRRVSSHVDNETWEAIRNALVDYLGQRPAGLVLWCSVADTRVEDRARRIERLQESGSLMAVELVRRLRASHGRELQEAWDLFAEPVDNWRTADREVFVDVARGRAVVRIQLSKNNGERITLEGPADSYLNLAGFITNTLVTVGDRGAFAEGTISYYREATMSLLEVLDQPDFSEAPAAEGQQAPDRPDELVN
jgi:hypothetical protein